MYQLLPTLGYMRKALCFVYHIAAFRRLRLVSRVQRSPQSHGSSKVDVVCLAACRTVVVGGAAVRDM